MSVNINADTTNGLVLTSDTSGEIKLQSAGADIATVDSSGITMAAGKTLPASALTGTLPSIDGSSLTGIPSIGVGQTWTNVTASRAIATQYTNTTGNPILVVISCTGNGPNGLFGAMVDGSTIMFSPSTASSGYWTSVSFVVPNGSTYNTNQQGANVTLGLWWELR
jgi:hypothetical protein